MLILGCTKLNDQMQPNSFVYHTVEKLKKGLKMKVKSIKYAWIEANKIFLTDNKYDTYRSKWAGYSIYYSTAGGVNAWSGSLKICLEVNLPDGKNINIGLQDPWRLPPATAPRKSRTIPDSDGRWSDADNLPRQGAAAPIGGIKSCY